MQQQAPVVRSEKPLCYAIVELVGEKGTANSIEKGLFKGIKNEIEDSFLWIKSGNTIAKSCNLKYYNVLSIETYDGDVRTFTFFMADENEQKEAHEALKGVFNGFAHILDERDPELIDVSKFTDVPENFGSHTSGKIFKSGTSVPYGTSAYNRSQQTNYSSSAFIRKEPEPFPFKRGTKKPTKAALKKINKKLDLIVKGEYKYELPLIEKEAAKE